MHAAVGQADRFAGGRAVEQAATVAAADVAAVGDALAHETQRAGIVPDDPRDAEGADGGLEPAQGADELALLHGHGDELVGERRPRPVGDERVQEREAVLAARHADGHAVAGPEHREPSHRSPDQVQHPRLDLGAGGLR